MYVGIRFKEELIKELVKNNSTFQCLNEANQAKLNSMEQECDQLKLHMVASCYINNYYCLDPFDYSKDRPRNLLEEEQYHMELQMMVLPLNLPMSRIN